MLPSTAPNPDLRVVAVALRTRPTSLAVPGFPPATAAAPASVPEPVLPSPPVAADAATVLLAAGVPPADLRSAVPHGGGRGARGGPPASAAVAPAPARVPRGGRLWSTLYFLRALGVPDLLSFSVEDKLLPWIEFLDSLGLPFSLFGSFFGPSKLVISQRVIEERKSMKELQNTMFRDRRPSGKDIPSSSKVQAKTNGFHQKQKIVNEIQRIYLHWIVYIFAILNLSQCGHKIAAAICRQKERPRHLRIIETIHFYSQMMLTFHLLQRKNLRLGLP